MTTYKQLKDEFDSNVEKLQENCEHKSLTPWTGKMWAPGHFSSSSSRFCKLCNKQTHKKDILRKCEKCGHIQATYMITCMKCRNEKSHFIEVYERHSKIISSKRIH